MSGRKTIQRKAERPSYENKAVVPAASVRVRVIKSHDGIGRGEIIVRPYEVAKTMQDLGFWKII